MNHYFQLCFQSSFSPVISYPFELVWQDGDIKALTYNCTHIRYFEDGFRRLAHHSRCFRGEKLNSAKVLSEGARHEKRETKEPMSHPVNTRPLWAFIGSMNCPGAKQSQLNSLIKMAKAVNCITLQLGCLRLLVLLLLHYYW